MDGQRRRRIDALALTRFLADAANEARAPKLYGMVLETLNDPDADERDIQLLAQRVMALANIDAVDPVPLNPATARPSTNSLSGEAKALALLVEHPDWTDKQIADAVPCSRTSLYRWDRYRAARKATGGEIPPSGEKSADGSVEAWDE